MSSGFLKKFSTILFSLLLLLLITNEKTQAQTVQGVNDLSFVVFTKDVFYGANAGSGNVELRFRFRKQNNQNIIYFDKYVDNQFFTFGAYTRNGIFIFIQDHPDTNIQKYLTSDEFEIQFHSLLFDSSDIFGLEIENIDANTFLVPDSNILIADKFGNLAILHKNNNSIELIHNDQPYYAVTFFHPYVEHNPNQPIQENAISHSALMDTIDTLDESFSVDSGFDVLKYFYPDNDRVTSILISPQDNQLYVSLDKDASEIWRFDINGGTVETHFGFDQNHKANIPKLGITTNDLFILNFSNEDLTVGIIAISIGILLIIIIPTIIILPKLDR